MTKYDALIEGFKHMISSFTNSGVYSVTLAGHVLTASLYQGDHDFNVTIYAYPDNNELYVNEGVPSEFNRFANPVEEYMSENGFVDMDGQSWKVEMI